MEQRLWDYIDGLSAADEKGLVEQLLREDAGWKMKYQELLEFLKGFQLRLPPHDQVQPKDFARLIASVKRFATTALISSSSTSSSPLKA